jgi:site-specific recombinase XerD
LAAATRRRKLSAIKTLFTWLRANDVISINPTKRVMPIQWQTKPPRVLTKAEYQHLLSVIENTRDRALLELILQTGIRLAEAHRLNLVDIEIPDPVTQQSIGVMRVIGRGGKVRSLLLNTKACRALYEWLGERPLVATDALFVSKREKRLSRRQMQNLIEKYVEQAGLTNVSLHSLRHTFATHHLMMGTDIELVKEFLGHQWLRTTAVYEELAESFKRIQAIQEHCL